jgi:hypothetical protein
MSDRQTHLPTRSTSIAEIQQKLNIVFTEVATAKRNSFGQCPEENWNPNSAASDFRGSSDGIRNAQYLHTYIALTYLHFTRIIRTTCHLQYRTTDAVGSDLTCTRPLATDGKVNACAHTSTRSIREPYQ